MKSIAALSPLFACLGFGLAAAGCYDASPAAPETTQTTADDPFQTSSAGLNPEVARATLKLENQFADQFTRGRVDHGALQAAIDDVIHVMPETARLKVLLHIAWVLDTGGKLASEQTDEQRAAAAAPPTDEMTRQTREPLVSAWGWPGLGGWGGYGAFAFPGMYSPYGIGSAFNPAGFNPPGFNPYTGNPPGVGGYGWGGGPIGFAGFNGPGFGGCGGCGGFGGGFGPLGLGFGSSYSTGYSMGYSYSSGYSMGYSYGSGLGAPGWFW